MNCPSCDTKLISITLPNATYQKCEKCKGILASGQVIAQIAKERGAALKPKEFELFSRIEAKHIYTLNEISIKCPKCGNQMEKINYAYDSNVFADKCRSCDLLWVEGGEMGVLAQHFAPNPIHERMGRAAIEMEKNRIKPRVRGDLRVRAPGFPVPVGDENPRLKFPYITAFILLINVLISLKMFLFPIDIAELSFWGVTKSNLFSIAIITSLFLHANIIHLLGNMLFLWIFGDNLEDSLGHFPYLLFYLGTGALTNLAFVALSQNELPLIGASTAISAIMGGYLILFPGEKIKVFFYNTTYLLPAKTYLFLYLGQQIIGTVSQGITTPIAYLGHLIGFVVGAATTYLLIKTNLASSVKHYTEY